MLENINCGRLWKSSIRDKSRQATSRFSQQDIPDILINDYKDLIFNYNVIVKRISKRLL